jgi:hypothetical protein
MRVETRQVGRKFLSPKACVEGVHQSSSGKPGMLQYKQRRVSSTRKSNDYEQHR